MRKPSGKRSVFWVLRRFLWLLLIAAFSAVLLLQTYYFVRIAWWVKFNPNTTAFMDRQLELMQKKNPKARLQHKWVPYDRISVHLKRAVVASEDANFSGHEGVDWKAMKTAWDKNQKKGRVVSGGSTITQQLAKNLFLSGDRSYLRKAQEFVITYMLEFWMDKERIFEIYLNVAEWGNGTFGAEAAARRHFGIAAAQIGPEQAARLAVMLPNPRHFDRNPNSAYLARRAEIIQMRMRAAELP